jgi:hypothetical protein
MTNVKAQMPNECQMTNAKTENKIITKIRKHEERIEWCTLKGE